jgi:hypothetical protein
VKTVTPDSSTVMKYRSDSSRPSLYNPVVNLCTFSHYYYAMTIPSFKSGNTVKRLKKGTGAREKTKKDAHIFIGKNNLSGNKYAYLFS